MTSGTFPGTSQCSDGTASPTQYPDDAATVASAAPQLLFYGGYYCDLGLLLGALHSAGYSGKVMSGDGSDSKALVTGTNPPAAANGVYATAPVLSSAPQGRQAFASGFKASPSSPSASTRARHSTPPTRSSRSCRSCRRHQGRKVITRINIVNGLHKIVYHGLTKTVSFESDGNINGDFIYVNQVQNGNWSNWA